MFTPNYKRLRELLIESREAAGVTQRELAARLKKPQSYVSKFERGERRLDVIEFFDVVSAIGAEPFKLLRKLFRPPKAG